MGMVISGKVSQFVRKLHEMSVWKIFVTKNKKKMLIIDNDSNLKNNRKCKISSDPRKANGNESNITNKASNLLLYNLSIK